MLMSQKEQDQFDLIALTISWYIAETLYIVCSVFESSSFSSSLNTSMQKPNTIPYFQNLFTVVL